MRSKYTKIWFCFFVGALLVASSVGADDLMVSASTPRTMPLNLDRAVPPTECIAESLRSGMEQQKYADVLRKVDASIKSAPTLCGNRLRWIGAKAAYASGKTERALNYLAALSQSDYPLRIWARLLSAKWIQPSKPDVAQAQAQELNFPWAGRELAEEIVTPPPPITTAQAPVGEQSQAERDFSKALGFYNIAQYESAQKIFAEIMKESEPGEDIWCRAALYYARSHFRNKSYQKSPEAFEEVVRECSDLDARAWALYDAARSFFQSREWEAAIMTFERVVTEAPHHTLADDAVYRAGLAEFELGREDDAKRRLRTLEKEYPKGDMWPLAAFRLAWIDFREKKYQAAIRGFEKLAQQTSVENREDVGGQATYWLGRSLEKSGNKKNAISVYATLCKHWPLRYYAQLAYGRLKVLKPALAAQVLRDMQSESPTNILVVTYKPKYESAAFYRAIELLRLGERDLALAEFAWLDMTGSNAALQDRFIVDGLLQRAGFTEKLDRSIRQYFLTMPGLSPAGANRALWDLAYPLSYEPLIDDTAERNNVNPALVRAIAREESSFNPSAISPARAYGLLQVTVPTAQRFSASGEPKASPNTLLDPEFNVSVGARFISSLLTKLGNPALAIAAYNAGEGSLAKWRSRFAGLDIDVFVEEIPYQETRQYTRRVLQSYGIYSWLHQRKLPEFWSATVK